MRRLLYICAVVHECAMLDLSSPVANSLYIKISRHQPTCLDLSEPLSFKDIVAFSLCNLLEGVYKTLLVYLSVQDDFGRPVLCKSGCAPSFVFLRKILCFVSLSSLVLA